MAQARKGILSKGIKFSLGTATYDTSTGEWSFSSYSEVPNLQSIPSLGGDIEKVDVTTLADGARQYINGIKDYGDLEFKFLYDNAESTSNYRVLRTAELSGDTKAIKIELPDETVFQFAADVAVSIDEAEVNQALTFTCSCGLQSDIGVSSDPV